jgi:hypothetical protein
MTASSQDNQNIGYPGLSVKRGIIALEGGSKFAIANFGEG